MRLPDAPCRKCGDRHIGCHNGCSRYAAYRLQIRPGRIAELEDAARNGQFFDRLKRIKKDTEHRRHKTQ